MAAVLLGSLVAIAAAPGCASASERPSRTSDPLGQVPTDFWLEVRVQPGAGVDGRAKVEERAVRFVLLPDGSLYGETDVASDPGARPPRLRVLSREQMAEVWQVLSNSGFASPRLADTRGSVRGFAPRPNEIVTTLELHARSERFAFARRYAPGGDDQIALRKAVRTIAALGWASDEQLAESAELPLRYDMGPDPYARFASGSRGAESPK